MSSEKRLKEFDLDFRPDDYSDVEDPISAVLVNVKGTQRREMITDILSGRAKAWAEQLGAGPLVELMLSELAPGIAAESLPDAMELGHVHPSFMGGEFLPDAKPGEVEVARIQLRSTTADVISVRARRSGSGYRYRVVDEYEVAYTNPHGEEPGPLSLGQLIELIDGIDDGSGLPGEDFPSKLRNYNVTDAGDLPRLVGFVTVCSEFYPDLERYYDVEAEKWLAREMARGVDQD
jgi:hypothetical protein